MWVIFLIATSYLCKHVNGLPSAARINVPLEKMPAASNDHFHWKLDNGVFRFGLQGQDQWRIESRYPNGSVYVRYAYRAPDGQIIESSFTRGGPPEIYLKDEEKHSYSKTVQTKAINPSLSSEEDENNIDVQNGGESKPDSFPDKDRIPYGALSPKFQHGDFEDPNSIVDLDAQAIVISLS